MSFEFLICLMALRDESVALNLWFYCFGHCLSLDELLSMKGDIQQIASIDMRYIFILFISFFKKKIDTKSANLRDDCDDNVECWSDRWIKWLMYV